MSQIKKGVFREYAPWSVNFCFRFVHLTILGLVLSLSVGCAGSPTVDSYPDTKPELGSVSAEVEYVHATETLDAEIRASATMPRVDAEAVILFDHTPQSDTARVDLGLVLLGAVPVKMALFCDLRVATCLWCFDVAGVSQCFPLGETGTQ